MPASPNSYHWQPLNSVRPADAQVGGGRVAAAPGAPCTQPPTIQPRPSAVIGLRLRLAHPAPCHPTPAMAAVHHATGLVINTLTFKPGETPINWLGRNGCDIAILASHGLSCSLLAEFGVPTAERHDRFVGTTFALLDFQLPGTMPVSTVTTDFEFAPSTLPLFSGGFFQQRYIKVWDTHLHFASPLPAVRQGWPLPLATILECLPAEQRSMVVGVLREVVDLKCNILRRAAVASDHHASEVQKRSIRVWNRLQALVNAIALTRKTDTQSTTILPQFWSKPCELPENDSCNIHLAPGPWLAHCCAHGCGIWVLRPGLKIPEATWVATVVHALKAKLLTSLVAQRAVPRHRMMRGHISPKMSNVFWVSCSAGITELPQADAADSTWRFCMMWRISIHQLRALPAESNATEVWGAGTLHILERAPRTLGGRGRMTFSPAAEDFGETLVLVLDYAGPAITAFMTLRSPEARLSGPVRAVLDLEGGAAPGAPNTDSGNELKCVFGEDFEADLPEHLHIIDDEQRLILHQMAMSSASVHVIHALAGCGKSTLLQCLVALYALRHAALPADQQDKEVLLVTLRTRTLRHEFLHALLDNAILAPEQVIFGGRLPDRLLDAGVLDDDVSHFEKICLASDAVKDELRLCGEARALLEGRHAQIVEAHSDGSWITAAETSELKRLAKTALQTLWVFFQAYQSAVEAALQKVAVVLTTTDAALKIFAKSANSSSPAARVMKKKRPLAIIMDEMQRCPAETYVALASRHTTLVAVGDRGQELYPLVPQWRGGAAAPSSHIQSQSFAQQARPCFAAELLLARAAAAPGALFSPTLYNLTETKRFGDPLAKYLAQGHPLLCASLQASRVLGKDTPVCHIWYTSKSAEWFNLEYFLARTVSHERKRSHTAAPAWQLSAAVWNDGLSVALAATVLLLLQKEVIYRRDASLSFTDGELVVLVCSAIRRVVGPFQLVLDSLLSDADVLAKLGLQDIRPEHVQVRLPGDLTGPSATYACVIRHPRFRTKSQIEWKDTDLQHHGQQSVDELNYIMESRPEKGLFVFIHDQAAHADVHRGSDDIARKKILEKDPALVTRYAIDCTMPQRVCLVPTQSVSWPLAVALARAHTATVKERSMEAIVRATGLTGEGDGDGIAESVQDTLKSLSSQEFVLQDERTAKRHGEARQEGPTPLADFGAKTWPRDPIQAFNADMTAPAFRAVLIELSWRLVDHVAVQIQGKTACQIAIPLLDPLPGYRSPNYATNALPAAPGAPSMLTSFVLCVWAVYEAQRSPDAKKLAIMSVHHKASVEESGGDEGVTWWSRACSTDREAVILLDAIDMELMLQDSENYRRPPKPRCPPLYCYIGCGVDRQPDCITGMVVRTKDPALTAAVATACRILGLNFPGNVPCEVVAELIESDSQEASILHDLLARIGLMWLPWVGHEPPQLLDKIIAWLTGTTPPWRGQQPARPALGIPDVATAIARVLQFVSVHEDEVDWGGSEDEDVIPDVVVPSDLALAVLPGPHPPPTSQLIRMGVDLGGVLLPKMPVRELRHIQTPEALARLGFVAGAREWFSECVQHCGPQNVFIVSYVSNQRLRTLFSTMLLGDEGLLTSLRVPPTNLVWTDSRSAKAAPFVSLGLTHFVDDGIDCLASILSACWAARPPRPPALYLIPSAWADGNFTDFGRCCATAQRASFTEPWCIFPIRSLGDLHPWRR